MTIANNIGKWLRESILKVLTPPPPHPLHTDTQVVTLGGEDVLTLRWKSFHKTHTYSISALYILNLYSIICQLYLSEAGQKGTTSCGFRTVTKCYELWHLLKPEAWRGGNKHRINHTWQKQNWSFLVTRDCGSSIYSDYSEWELTSRTLSNPADVRVDSRDSPHNASHTAMQ